MPTWPASLPQAPLLGSLTITPEDIASSFQPDVGPPIIRMETTTAGENLKFSMAFREAQFDTLVTFWNDTLGNGQDAFDWTHPVEDTVESFRFIKPPRITQRTDDYLVTQIDLYFTDAPLLLLEDGFFFLMEDASRILLG